MDRVEQWRQGFFAQTRWEDLAIDDMDVRLKWAGLFHRKRRTPGRFMLRLKVRDSAVPCLLRLCASPGIAASCTCSESGSQCSCLCQRIDLEWTKVRGMLADLALLTLQMIFACSCPTVR